MLTSHDNRNSPFPCLLACLTVPACLCIRLTAVKWIWISELERSLPLLSFVLSMPTYRLCLFVSWSTTTLPNETVLPAECLWWRFCEIDQYHCPQKGPYFKDLVLYKDLIGIGVLIGSLFIFQGPYFHCFGFIHAKNVNLVCMYTTMVPV